MTQMAQQYKMGTRIIKWRQSQDPPLKAYQFAKIIKISQGSLSDIENLKSLPSAITLNNLHLYTRINIIWVITGIGPDSQEIPEDMDVLHCQTCDKLQRILTLVTDALEDK